LSILVMGASLFLFASLPCATWLCLFIWLSIGLVIYFGYGRSHSRVAVASAKPPRRA
jgi:APA family basic amino acid/polyamine antiporter